MITHTLGRMAPQKTRVGRPFLRRRLAKELVKLRNERGLTAQQVSKQVEVAQSSISRAEQAVVTIGVPMLKAILDVYEVEGEQRDAILQLCRSIGQEAFWHSYHDVLPDWFTLYVDLEAEANELMCYDAAAINGLVQTRDYAAATFGSYHPDDDPAEISRKVDMRLERQRRIESGDLRLVLVIEESIFERPVGSGLVMHDQIQHLRKVADLRNVTVQVMPKAAPVSVTGSFTILDFPDPIDPSVVYLEHEAGGLYLEEPEQLRIYARVFSGLRAQALSPTDSVEYLDRLLGVPA